MDPLLSNPPGFVLLGVAIGLSAYLRQLSEKRQESIENLLDGKYDSQFPVGSTHREEQLAYWERSRKNLNRVAPYVIGLTLWITVRLTGLATVRLIGVSDPAWLNWSYRISDEVVMVFLIVLVSALWHMHNAGSKQQQEIRLVRQTWIDAQLAAKSSASEPRQALGA